MWMSILIHNVRAICDVHLCTLRFSPDKFICLGYSIQFSGIIRRRSKELRRDKYLKFKIHCLVLVV